MLEIAFEFSLEKLVNALAFFAETTRDLTKLKALKLLYFADKNHLLTQGAPILGDVYWCMDFGPVPSASYIEMNEAIQRPEVERASADADVNIFDRLLRVRRPLLGYPHFELRPNTRYDATLFSATEMQVLQEVRNSYGQLTAQRLVDLAHAEPTWRIPNQNRPQHGRSPIPYDLFFTGAPVQSQRLLAKLKAEQCGEAIPLPGDAVFAQFAREMLEHESEPDFSLDPDHAARRIAAR